MTFDIKTGATKRFVSRWIPGDFIAGSAGPPIVISTETIEEENDERDESTIVSAESTEIEKKKPKEKKVVAKEKTRKVAVINENFAENPMYPFLVSNTTVFSVALYQQDLRWNVGRLGEDSAAVLVETYSTRGSRLKTCMQYPIAIGFVVLKLNGLKHRVTEFKLKKVVAKSQGLQFSNVVSATVRLRPGRYAVVPYTHVPLDRSMDYILHFNFNGKHIEFEIEDVIAQRLMDDAPSDDEDDINDNDLIRLNPETEEVSLMSYERVEDDEDSGDGETGGEFGDSMRAREVTLIPPPSIIIFDPAEYYEETEELGVVSIFHEVGDLMKYLKALKSEVHSLQSAIKISNSSATDEFKSNDKYII